MPIAGVTAAYLLNIQAGVLPSCIPFIDGCTSISSTGRSMPGSMPFRAVLLPQALGLVFLWWISVAWLREISPKTRVGKPVLVCGVVGAIALILYVSFLGSQQPLYEFMKRFGIYFYFLGTAISQLLVTIAMGRSRLRTAMLWVISTPYVLGIVNLVQKSLLLQSNNIENRIEWSVALLMQVWFVLLFLAWRNSDLTVTVRTDSTSVHS
jgi:hypothetical protein